VTDGGLNENAIRDAGSFGMDERRSKADADLKGAE